MSRSMIAATAAAAAAASVAIRRRLWSSVQMRDLLGSAGGPTSRANAINDSGTIVGTASGRAFCVEQDELRWLTDFGTGSSAEDLAADGAILGVVFDSSSHQRPLLWTYPDRRPVDLELPDGDSSVVATSTNGRLTVGWERARVAAAPQYPVQWHGSALYHLDLGDWLSAAPAAISHHGTAVGSGVSRDGRTRGLAWRASGEMVELATETGGPSSAASINNSGSIVGTIRDAAGHTRACIWDAFKPAIELPGLASGVSEATSVNERGVIAGWSTTNDGKPLACVWVPDPESTSLSDRYTCVDIGTLGGDTSFATSINSSNFVVGIASTGMRAFNMPLRPGGWSWEDHAFVFELPQVRPDRQRPWPSAQRR